MDDKKYRPWSRNNKKTDTYNQCKSFNKDCSTHKNFLKTRGKTEKSPIRNQKIKFKWHDDKGNKLTAGGILAYDDSGIWVIEEKKTKNGDTELTDPGGKYRFEDGDIDSTIDREFREELYNSSRFSRDIMLKIKETHEPTYVNGHQKLPVYICYVVHTDILDEHGVHLDPDLFDNNRKKVLSENPDVPPDFYNSIKLKHVTFDEIEKLTQEDVKPVTPLSYRLKRILKYGPLKDRISDISTNSDRSVSPDISDNPAEDGEKIPSSPLKLEDIVLHSPIPVKSSPTDFSYISNVPVLINGN